MRKMRIGVVQFAPQLLKPAANIATAIRMIRDNPDADVYVLPELFVSGYSMKNIDEIRSMAIRLQGDSKLKDLCQLSAEMKVGICGGYVEDESARYFNSSFFIGDGAFIANYRKVHLFNNEKELFSPSYSGFKVFTYKNARLGMMICYDWIFPEAARSLTLLGAEVILHPANLVLPWCQQAMYARALENRVFIATCNRIGREKNGPISNVFTGRSQIVSPSGKYLFRLPPKKEMVKIMTIDCDEATNKTVSPKNNLLNDRRLDQYKV